MKKRFILSGLVLMLLFGLSATDQHIVYASSYDCEITIDANKHSWGNFATQTSGCEMAVVHGYFVEGQGFLLIGSYTGQVNNGQIIEAETDRIKINTIPLKKPEPKPAPQEPKPEKPKEVKPKPQPKQETKPKQEPKKEQPKQETKPKQEPKKEQPKSSGNSNSNTSSKSVSGNKTSTESSNTPSKNTKESSDKEEPEKRFTIEELMEKNAEVIRENGKIYAKVGNIKQEITEEEAKMLESDEQDEEEKEELNLEEKEDEEIDEVTPVVKNEQDKGNSGFGLMVTLAIIVILIITLASLYYFHPKSREKMDEILAKCIGIFSFGKKKEY